MVESQIDQFKFGGTKELGLDKYKEDEKQIIREQSRENLEKNDTSNEVQETYQLPGSEEQVSQKSIGKEEVVVAPAVQFNDDVYQDPVVEVNTSLKEPIKEVKTITDEPVAEEVKTIV